MGRVFFGVFINCMYLPFHFRFAPPELFHTLETMLLTCRCAAACIKMMIWFLFNTKRRIKYAFMYWLSGLIGSGEIIAQ